MWAEFLVHIRAYGVYSSIAGGVFFAIAGIMTVFDVVFTERTFATAGLGLLITGAGLLGIWRISAGRV